MVWLIISWDLTENEICYRRNLHVRKSTISTTYIVRPKPTKSNYNNQFHTFVMKCAISSDVLFTLAPILMSNNLLLSINRNKYYNNYIMGPCRTWQQLRNTQYKFALIFYVLYMLSMKVCSFDKHLHCTVIIINVSFRNNITNSCPYSFNCNG